MATRPYAAVPTGLSVAFISSGDHSLPLLLAEG